MEESKKEITLLDIAEVIERGFTAVASKDHIKELKNDIHRIDGKLDHLEARVGNIEGDIKEIKGNMVYREEFIDVKDRVKYVEKKLGIESGV